MQRVLNTSLCCSLVSKSVRLIRQQPRLFSKKFLDSQYPGLEIVRNMSKDRLVWVDLEMTGLDIDTCHIIEMACLITDGNLNVIAEGPNLVIHQPEDILSAMGEWCTKHHGESGLTAAVRASDISLLKAEDIMINFIKEHVPSGICPLAGNSVHEDKRFLVKYMPRFMEQLHYRIVDVSTIKELCRRWYPKDYSSAPPKACQHRALDDIRESIKELQYYRGTIFKSANQ